jgi:3-phenylpropionate/trans-cinnamate dioxygenase ferredoxin reductase subunit
VTDAKPVDVLAQVTYVIVGGGAAAARAVEGIRDRDPHGAVAVFTAEWAPPYQRPPLSKEFLQGRAALDSILMQPPAWYAQHDVEINVGAPVEIVDPRAKTIHALGQVYGYDRLLLACGAKPRLLSVPGSNLPGVYVLRSYEDALRLAAVRASAREIIVLGSGFIGLETAASLRGGGANVTLVTRDDALWSMLGPVVSTYVRELFERNGVQVVLNATITALEGRGRVEGAVLSDGTSRRADAVVAGLGVRPNDGLAAEAGLHCEDGIVVDDHLLSSDGSIFAAGDVARFPAWPSRRRTRVEHFDHAFESGYRAGANMAGAEEAYKYIPFFWSDVFDFGFEFVGEPTRESKLIEGEAASGSFVIEYYERGELMGALLAKRTPEESAAYRERLGAAPV